jgi:hypothetical protein
MYEFELVLANRILYCCPNACHCTAIITVATSVKIKFIVTDHETMNET